MWWVDSAIANSLPQYALEYFARVMKVNDLNIVRCHLDQVDDGENGEVTQLRMLVEPAKGGEGCAGGPMVLLLATTVAPPAVSPRWSGNFFFSFPNRRF